MLIIFIRSIIIYIIVLIVMRLMGKREIGQMQPFELVISIMIADLASIPISDIGIPISNGIVSILGLLVMHLIISVININNSKIKDLICGKPTILIYKGKIDEKKMRKERFTISELEEKLRTKNIFDLGDVEYAILETSGDISVIPKPNKKQVTLKDLNIEAEFEGLAYNLIIDGKIIYKNLEKIKKDYNWLQKETKKFNIKPDEALVFAINAKGDVFCQKRLSKQEKKKKEKMEGNF